MAIISPRSSDNTITVKTKTSTKKDTPGDWWNANTKDEMASKLLGTQLKLK